MDDLVKYRQVEFEELLDDFRDDKIKEQKENETKLDKALRGDCVSEIVADYVTPKNLTSCHTNSLEKALEVSHTLKELANSQEGPDREDLSSLAHSVEDFSFHLLDPLKSRHELRETFAEGIDIVLDKSLSCRTKKFVSHPVVYNLLKKRWKGSFYGHGWWAKLLLHLLVMMDVFVFPLVFAVLYLGHVISKKLQRRNQTFFQRYIIHTPHLIFVRDTVSYLILVVLHFAVCLQPTVLQLSALEWVIMVFFVGRIFMEIYQAKQEKDIRKYLGDLWNALDLVTIAIYVVLFFLRIVTWVFYSSGSNSRLVTLGAYLYGINAMVLTLRVCGQILEYNKTIGTIQIALFKIIGAIMVIVGQILAFLMAFSFAITKIYIAEATYSAPTNSSSHGLCTAVQDGLTWYVQHL